MENKSRSSLWFAALGAVLVISACAGRADSSARPDRARSTLAVVEVSDQLKTRLQRLESQLQAARQAQNIPGLAIAVVKDDQLIFAKGMGYADVEAKKPVTHDTLFAVGSTTKAFTATLIGMLIDDGKLTWDEPIARRVPEFALKLQTADKDAVLTLRDLLSHRSGYTRMSLLWIGGNATRNQMLADAANAEPWAEFRKKFLYNNVTYAAVGEAGARAFGGAWKQLLQTRILDPLGMTSSNTSIGAIKDDPRLAKGYAWKEVESQLENLPMRNLDVIGPAGAINSNIVDMAQWLRFQLAKGTFEGKPLIQPKTLAETWTPQMKLAPNVDYGLGWFVRQWKGKRVIEHGGNIDGFSAQVAMIPEDNLGFVLLMNTSIAKLQTQSRTMVWQALLGDLPAGDQPQKEDFTPFIGVYIGQFGPFDNAEFRVSEQDGKLFVDVPTQMNFELAPPGDNGRRPFVMTNAVEVSFSSPENGRSNAMNLYQGGFTFELFRQGYTPKPEIPLAELQRYLGSYADETLGEAKVLVRNNRLAIDIPKQTTFELHPPNDAGRWVFRAKADIELIFAEEGQAVTGLTVYRGGKQEAVFKRTAATAAKLPTPVELAKLRGAASFEAAMDKVGVLEMRGTVRSHQTGLRGQITLYVARDGRAARKVDFGVYGWTTEVILPDRAWSTASFSPMNEEKGKYLVQAQLSHPLTVYRDWNKVFDSVRVTGTDKLDGREVYTVELIKDELPPMIAMVDRQSGDLLQLTSKQLHSFFGVIPTTTRFGDVRDVFGMRMPLRAASSDDHSGRVTVEFDAPIEYKGDPAAVFPTAP